MHTSMTSTRSKVKVKITELLKFRKLHFSRSISSAILAWSSRLMVDDDNMGPSLQLIGAQTFAECQYYRTFKGPDFPIAWDYGDMVRCAGSPICIVLAYMTLPNPRSRSCGDDCQSPSGAFIRYLSALLWEQHVALSIFLYQWLFSRWSWVSWCSLGYLPQLVLQENLWSQVMQVFLCLISFLSPGQLCHMPFISSPSHNIVTLNVLKW